MLLICVHPGPDRLDRDWQLAAGEAALDLRDALLRSFGRHYLGVYSQPSRGKPEPGMLFDAISFFGAYPEQITYIGDMPTDAAAAVAAGCRYLDAVVWRERGLG